MPLTKYVGKLISLAFRLILVLYSLFIIEYQDNTFEQIWYILAIVPYLIIYYKTLFKEGFFSICRLLNDYAFITFILFDKEVNYINIIFLSLPIIYSPNYSGERKSFILYLLYIISFLIINNFTWSWSFLGVVLILSLINILSDIRSQYYRNTALLNNQIEKFLETDLQINKTYKIYAGLIQSLNSITFLPWFKPIISKIICFRVSNEKIYLENSSHFIWSYLIDDSQVLHQKQNQKTQLELSSIDLTLDGIPVNNNFYIFNKSKGQEYLFIFIAESKLKNNIGVFYLKKLLTSITNRISRVIGVENEIKQENKKLLKNFREKFFQIQNAEKAMHFIRNRFNTLDNFIEMSKDNIAGIMDSEDLGMYKTELTRLERSYRLLMDRVKSILDKSDKPFSVTKLEKKSINFLFNLIREEWLTYFSSYMPIINIDINLVEKQEVNINTDGFYILIVDWISNVKKYSLDEKRIIFDEKDGNFIVTFENSFSLESKQDIEALKRDFNSTDREKILQRTSYGVLIIKSILEEMNILGVIEVNDNILRLILTLKKQTNENSNI